jgi:hypothetical protein
MKKNIFYLLSTFFPKKYKRFFAQLLIHAGDSKGVRYWLGLSMFFALIVMVLIPLIVYVIVLEGSFLYYILIGTAAFFLVHFFFYLYIYFKIQDRTNKVEEALPDFLQLVASNIRAGTTPYQAMKLSARDEFGPLKEEIEYATSRALGTESFIETILCIRDRIKSDVLNRTLELLASSLKSGGKLAITLNQLAVDISQMKDLKKDLVTSTKTYSMFILFTVIVGAPLLMAISVNFLDTILGIQEQTGGIEGGIVSNVSITVPFLMVIAVLFLIITSVLSSVLMGVIKEGKYFQGLRFSVFIAAGAVTMFFIFRILVGGFLG